MSVRDRILAELDRAYHRFSTETSGSARMLNAAVRAVLALHAPVPGSDRPMCCCGNPAPCRTELAIAGALGINTEETQ